MAPAMSSDGRYIVFVSHANNLVTNDNLRPFLDVFVRDLQTSTTTLISVNTNGMGGGNGNSSHASISTNGQFVLFSSDANDLVANDTNGIRGLIGGVIQTSGFADIFLRDLISGTTTMVSVGTNGSGAWGGRWPIMTPDARFVVFLSEPADLLAGETNYSELFIRDMQMGVTRAVAPRVNNNDSRSRASSASVSVDGRRVAFVSTATNLGPNEVNQTGDVYVRDVPGASTYWASSNLTIYFNTVTNGYKCLNSVISPDGEKVAFKAVGPDGVTVHLLVHDIGAGSTTGVATNSHGETWPSFSADGRWLAFEENNAIYMRDLANGTNLLVSVNSFGNGPADGISMRPVVTPDGRYVGFVSSASNLRLGTGPLSTNVFRIYRRDVVVGVTRLVAPTRTDMHPVVPAISADGRVAFDTDAPDIVANDNNKSSDVFMEGLGGAATHLVSVRHTDRPARPGVQSTELSVNSISSNAQRIAFSSLDDLRVPFDTNGQHDVFVRDRNASSLFSISDPALRAMHTNEAAFNPILSANGEGVLYLREQRYYPWVERVDLFWKSVAGGPAQVVYPYFSQTFLSQLPERSYAALSPDGNTVVYPRSDDLVWTNMITGSSGLVSARGLGSPAGPSRSPTFSHNGRFVAFPSSAAFLLTNALNGIFGRHMYVRDLHSNTTRLLSIDADGTPLSDVLKVTSGVFSGNDRFVIYDGTFTTNQWPQIYRFDMDTGENLLVCTNCRNPSVSFDGQTIAYNSTWGRLANSNINVIDLRTGDSEIITRDYTGNLYPAPQFDAPSLSADGRYVVFASKVATLVLNDTNRLSDIFVHDRVQNTTVLLTRAYDGARSGNGQSTQPVMAKDGRTVFFQSFAGDLVDGDYNERRDIFVVRLGVGDSDNDGMEDDWEVAQFGNLDRDGTGDQDSDGQTDMQEYLAGTNPTSDGSVLRVMTVTPLSGGNTTVVWSAVVGRNYVVQYKDALPAGWSNASGVIEANSISMSFAHNTSSPQRFYRVIAVQ